MSWISILAAPLIGAVIGYCTNYIAVKMLFRPLKPVKIGNYTLPFTPGIIPKRKPVLAHAVGRAVGTSLVGEEEIKKMLSSEEMKDTIVSGISNSIKNTVTTQSVKECATTLLDKNLYEEKKDHAIDYASDKIVEGILSINIGDLIVAEGSSAVKQMGGMIAMFVNDDLLRSFAGPISQKVEEYIKANGKGLIEAKVATEVEDLEAKQLSELIDVRDTEKLSNLIGTMYDSLLDQEVSTIAQTFDICQIVEDKINEMDVKELETLIMSVMKNELGMIVNLGAVIGFVLGLFNLLF